MLKGTNLITYINSKLNPLVKIIKISEQDQLDM